MGYNLLKNGVYWGELTHLLTFDPNFQRDIQVPFLPMGMLGIQQRVRRRVVVSALRNEITGHAVVMTMGTPKVSSIFRGHDPYF